MDGGVTGAEYRTRGFGQQTIAVEQEARSQRGQKQRGVGREMAQNRARRHGPRARLPGEEPETGIDHRERHGASERKEGNHALNQAEERQCKQVEGDVMAVEWLGLAKGLCPEKSDQLVPFLGEAEPDDHRGCERGEHLEQGLEIP